MRPYLVRTGVAVDTEDCAGTGVDLCVGCVDENEVFPGDGGGDGGRPVTGVPGCPARYTPGCWSEDSWVRLLSHRVVWREDCSYFW